MIDIIVNGGIIDNVSVSKGTVTKVDKHQSIIDISSCHTLPISPHIRLWQIGIVCVIITTMLGCFIYGIKIICHQSNQIKQMEIEFQECESRLLQMEEELNLLNISKYTLDEISLDSINTENIETLRYEEQPQTQKEK